VVGVGQQFTEGGQVYIFIYSKKAIIETIANDIVEEINNRVNTSDEERAELAQSAYDDAVEYFDYNIAGAYIGRGMPVFLEDTVDDAVKEALDE
jgi:CRISPR/Cas system-associated exonuclease Cas4 (RecB family)